MKKINLKKFQELLKEKNITLRSRPDIGEGFFSTLKPPKEKDILGDFVIIRANSWFTAQLVDNNAVLVDYWKRKGKYFIPVKFTSFKQLTNFISNL